MKIVSAEHKKSARLMNSGGFTLLEMLYAFSIFLIIVSLLPLSFKYLFHDWQYDSRIQRMEWQVFSSQLKKELRLSDDLVVSNNRIILKKGDQAISFEKYGTNIRRRAGFKGHEIALQRVKSVSYTRIKGGVKITVKDLFNQTHSALLYSYIEMGNDHAP